ncbi:MAG: hypothetical protein F6J94_12480, partial [Moorea sp. SIO1F2]|uniref:hypothetical protein n=1 Tax=Moorena sp. SIO1F2 TaxID=2607819 RepID=UPI0013B6472D
IGLTDHARAAGDRSLELATGTANPTAISWARVGVGMAELADDPARAARTLSAARRLARTVDNRWVGQMAILTIHTIIQKEHQHLKTKS